MSIPHHPDAPVLWLRIVAADPAYTEHLSIGTCSAWLHARERHKAGTLYCIDRDGDVYVLDRGNYAHYHGNWGALIVVDGDTVSPCTGGIAELLDTRRGQWWRDSERVTV